MTKPLEPIELFELLTHGVQAMRRYVERLACPIQGGSGVRAHFYPHQIQNVQRILSATRVRHLIADEVGMGKTIQALMVANAMRLQKGELRVRVVVGRSELQSQWAEEVCRSHQIIWDKEEAVFGNDWFEVVNESSIPSYADVFDANAFDLLIIDEPQSLKVETLRYVSEHSSEYASLLLLTASPNLRSIERFCELLQMLEPQRIERARREIDRNTFHEDASWSKSRIRDLDDAELIQVFDNLDRQCVPIVDGAIDPTYKPDGATPVYENIAVFRRTRMLTDLSWRYRRVLRSYREDYPDHLPRRHSNSFSIEPTDLESKRVALAKRYAKEHLRLDGERSMTFLRRATVGSESFQSQLRTLRKNEGSGASQIEHLVDVTSRANADTRLDFLVDWLIRFWHDGPRHEVLIAAQDNATVEELEQEIGWRIPVVGARSDRTPLLIATARDSYTPSSDNEEEQSKSSEAMRSVASSQLREFKMGGKQLLIATDSFRQSYNLQSADALIFFSIPWRPEDVDQWIGRVDRLGRGFVAPEVRKSPPKPVKIITINRHGDPTLALERVFDEYRILESAVDIEAELADQISARIANAVFDANEDAGEERQQLRRNREVLPPTGSCWSVKNAIETHSEMAFGDALEPQLRHTKPLGFVSNNQEQCLASWVTLLANHQQIATRKVSRKFTDGSRRGAIWTLSQLDCSGTSLQSLQDHSQSFPAFFIARRNVYSPPRLYTVTGKTHEGIDRQVLLQFLSHGSPLHEELISTYREAGRATTPMGITLFAIGPRHFPNGTSLKSGNYPVGVGFIDAADVYRNVSPRGLLASSFGKESGNRRTSMRDGQVLHFQAGAEADQRFVRMVASTKSCCLAFSGAGKPCSDRDSADLLTAQWSRDERPNTNSNSVPKRMRDGLPLHFRVAIATEMKRFWGQSIEQTEELIEERIEMIRIEAFNSVWNLRSAMDEASKQIEELESSPSEQNDQTIRMTYRPRLSLLEEEIRIVEFACKSRCELLEESLSHLKSPGTETVELQAIAVIGLQNDPVPMPVQEPDEEADDEAHSTVSEFQTPLTPSGDDLDTKPNKPR